MHLPQLGVTVHRTGGEPLVVKDGSEPSVAHVRLVQSVTIPSLKGSFAEAKVRCVPFGEDAPAWSHLLFEPKSDLLESRGLSSYESLVCASEDSCVFVPIHNVQGCSASLEAGTSIA